MALPSSRDGALGELLEAARRYTAQGQESCSDLPNNPARKPMVAGDPASAKARSENVNTFGGGTGGSNPVPSSEESANFRSLSGGRIGLAPNPVAQAPYLAPPFQPEHAERDSGTRCGGDAALDGRLLKLIMLLALGAIPLLLLMRDPRGRPPPGAAVASEPADD